MRNAFTPMLVTGLLAGVLVAAPGAGTAHAAPTCRGLAATIVGTPGDDHLAGTDGDDVIVTRDGADHVSSGPGRDLICLGRGDDFGDGQDGRDIVRGGAGADYLVSHVGRDRVAGGRGRDVLFLPSPAGTAARGGPGDDAMTVSPRVSGRLDVLGGAGWDQIGLHVQGQRGAVTIDQAAGTIDLAGTAGVFAGFAYVNLTGHHDWTYRGTDRVDQVVSLQGPTTAVLRGGDDRVWVGDFDDWIDGGPGHDTSLGVGGGTNYCLSVEQIDSGVCSSPPAP